MPELARDEYRVERLGDEQRGGFRAYDRRTILDEIENQLSAEPGVETRHRKILAGLVLPFEAVPPIWQLAVGDFRVFYDVNEDDKIVVVRAVRRKPPHATTEEIL